MTLMQRPAVVLIVCAAAAAQGGGKIEDQVEAIRRSAVLIDTHNDVPSRTVDGFDIGSSEKKGHTDIARLRKGGVGAVFFSAYVAPEYADRKQSAHRALEMIDTVRRDIARRYPGDFLEARAAADIEAARRQGKVAALIGIEGGHAIEDSLRLLRDFYDLGVRYMTLTHANTNDWADSAGDVDNPKVAHHNGLTDFGRQVIAEMNRLGMMVDISHVSDKTFWDALAASRAPVFASHSSCRALCEVPRNMTDEMIVALAKKGGVIQVNFNCAFLTMEKPAHATLADVVAHIDHIRKIAGIDAIGIGTDFNGVSCTPEGLEDVSKFPNLTRALLEKGYTEQDIRKIYGGNLLRVFRAVEVAAGK